MIFLNKSFPKCQQKPLFKLTPKRNLTNVTICSTPNPKMNLFTNNTSNKELNQSLIKMLATQLASASLIQLETNKNKFRGDLQACKSQFDVKDKGLHKFTNIEAKTDLNTLQQKKLTFVNTKETNFLKNLTKYNYYYQTDNKVNKSIDFLDNKNPFKEYNSTPNSFLFKTNPQSLQFLQKIMLILLRRWDTQACVPRMPNKKYLTYSKRTRALALKIDKPVNLLNNGLRKLEQPNNFSEFKEIYHGFTPLTNNKSTKHLNISNGYFNALNKIKTGSKPWFHRHTQPSTSGLSPLSSSVGLAYFSKKKSFLSYWLIPFVGFYTLVANSTYSDINIKAEVLTQTPVLVSSNNMGAQASDAKAPSLLNQQKLNNQNSQQNVTKMLSLNQIWFNSLHNQSLGLGTPSMVLERLAIDYLKSHSNAGFITYQPQNLTILNANALNGSLPAPSSGIWDLQVCKSPSKLGNLSQILLTNHKIKKSKFLWYWNNLNALCSKDNYLNGESDKAYSPLLSNNSNNALLNPNISAFNLFKPSNSNVIKIHNYNYGLKTTQGDFQASTSLPSLVNLKSQKVIVNTKTFELLNTAKKKDGIFNLNKQSLDNSEINSKKSAFTKLNALISFKSAHGLVLNTTGNSNQPFNTQNFILVSSNNSTMYDNKVIPNVYKPNALTNWDIQTGASFYDLQACTLPRTAEAKSLLSISTPITDYKKVSMFLDKLITNYNWSLVNQSFKDQKIENGFISNTIFENQKSSLLKNNKLGLISGAEFVINPNVFKDNLGQPFLKVDQSLNSSAVKTQALTQTLQTDLLFNNKYIFTLLNTKLNSLSQINSLQSKRAFNSKLDSIYSFLVNTTLNKANNTANSTVDFDSLGITTAKNVTTLENKINTVCFIKLKNPICTSSSFSGLKALKQPNSYNTKVLPAGKVGISKLGNPSQKVAHNRANQFVLENSNQKLDANFVNAEALTKATNYNPFLNQSGFSSSWYNLTKNINSNALFNPPQVLNNFDLNSWVIIKTKLFNNYVKYIQFKIKNFIFNTQGNWVEQAYSTQSSMRNVGFTSLQKQSFNNTKVLQASKTDSLSINSKNFKKILIKYLPFKSHTNNVLNQRRVITLNGFKSNFKTTFLSKPVLKRLKYNFTKAIPLVLKHKKFFKTKQLLSNKPTGYKSIWLKPTNINFYNPIPTTIWDAQVHAPLSGISKLGNPSQYSILTNNSIDQSYTNYMFSKKEIQQKRKAKKQRLESRRQKKRKRFYPRPSWLRLRLGLKITDTLQPLTLPMVNKEKIRLNSFNFIYNPKNLKNLKSIELKSKFKQINFTNGTKHNITNTKTTLNSYVNKLDTLDRLKSGIKNNASALGFYKLVKPVEACNSVSLNIKQFVLSNKFNSINNSMASKFQKVKNINQYNNIVLNLWINAKKVKYLNQSFASNPLNLKPNKKINIKNKFLTSKKALIYLKNINSKQYVNFEKPTNPTMPKKTESNRLREFWIWLYNITSTNSWNQSFLNPLINQIGMPIRLKPLSVDNNQNKKGDTSGNSLDKANLTGVSNRVNVLGTNTLKTLNLQPNVKYLNWALNKTYYWSSTTKRFNLWTNQKLRNQSKNNKTKFIEKQLKNKINTGLSSIYLKSLTNDYKTGVSVLQAWKSDALTSNTFYKFKLSKKLHQKEQKLAYLASMSQKTANAKQIQIRAKNSLNNYNLNNNFISKPTVNLAWWHSKQPNNFFYSENNPIFVRKANAKQSFYPSFNFSFNKQGALSKDNTYTQEGFQTYNITIIALLFHFCALISLISISQIRCFIKFHVILLHKLSNIYLQLIYKNLNITKRAFSNIIQSKSYMSNLNNGFNQKSQALPIDKFKTSINFTSLFFLNAIMPQTFLSNLNKPQNKSQINLKDRFYLANLFKVKNLDLSKEKFLKKSFLNKFSFSLQQSCKLKRTLLENLNKTKTFKKFKKLNTLDLQQSSIPIYSSIKKSNNIEFKYVPMRFGTHKPVHTVQSLTTNQNIKPTLNYYKDLNSFIKQLFLFWNLQNSKFPSKLIKTDKTLNTKFKNSKQSQSVGFLNKKELDIKALYYQLELTEYTVKTTKAAQKFAVNTSYKVVDSFEYILRIIYSFFEKPAEFTMDWIAYAFLVEWSSDLLAFTPEKTEKQVWLTFSKLSRQSKISKLQNDGFLQFFSINSTMTNYTLFIWNLMLGQLLYKRILYLNDMFLEILNRPDSDLLNRQKKGALFWDIWSDILIKAADKYNINVPSLSNIKEEQNVLIDKFLADNMLLTQSKNKKDLNQQIGVGTYINLESHSVKKNTFNKTNSFLKANAKNPYGFTSLQNQRLSLDAPNKFEKPNLLVNNNSIDINQFVTYQSKENDLFLDYHPPKSFAHISAIRYYNLVQQPLGTIVCQIYSGLFTKQIAKNILVIGSTLNTSTNTALERTQKTLLIQALAGETEIKIITDNASRYAIVNRGFAVGIKLLKDVFEAISLNTPCFFLLEDIHLIGERRPLLISDSGSDNAAGDELSKSTDYTFGSQRNGEAVHEKNQILYQLNMHGITHYKKPFKGDFSLSIPTNHFTFDLFLKQATRNGTSAIPTHPLAYSLNSLEIDKITNPGQSTQNSEYSLTNTLQKLTSNRSTIATNFDIINKNKPLGSSLQLASNNLNKLLSPPSTSPFTVLLLKEQKKLKPKKTVKELPWLGLSNSEQQLGSAITGTSRISYSVRAKVAALADLSFSNMSAKLDMITDLLVIIDSVRGNRGFVVFATTHLPHILDPALRRPGRLDETICIPTLSNIWTRWEFTKTTEPVLTGLNSFVPSNTFLQAYNNGQTLNTFSSYSLSNNFALLAARFNFITRSASKTILGYNGTIDHLDFINLDFVSNQNTNIFSSIVTANYSVKTQAFRTKSLENTKYSYTNKEFSRPKVTTELNKLEQANQPSRFKFKKQLKQMFCISYNQIGKNLITNKYTFSLSNLTPSYYNPTTLESTISLTETHSYLMNVLQYNSLYSSTNLIQNTICGLLSGKLSEGFVNSGILKNLVLMSGSQSKGLNKNSIISATNTSSAQHFVQTQKTKFPKLETSVLQAGKSVPYTAVQDIASNIINLYGIDQTWRAATSLALSFVQKRYLYNKNLIVPKLLNFIDYTALEEAPSPPLSNILIPAKRYENAKKTLKENIERKVSISIIEKLETHNKQTYIKSIYKTNQKDQFKPNIVNPNALATIGNSKNPLAVISSANWHYQSKILKRHRNYLNNQWWNGQLTEHSSEALFLSDIDWRFTFIDNLNTSSLIKGSALDSAAFKTKINHNSVKSTSNNSDKPFKDILIDFPDAEQHYNPKHRRWMLTYGTWSSWFSIDKTLQTDIFNHLIFESIVKSFSLLDQNRELLDYAVSKYMTQGLLKEFYLNSAIRKFSSLPNF